MSVSYVELFFLSYINKSWFSLNTLLRTGCVWALSKVRLSLKGTLMNDSRCSIAWVARIPTSPPSKYAGYSTLGITTPFSKHHSLNTAQRRWWSTFHSSLSVFSITSDSYSCDLFSSNIWTYSAKEVLSTIFLLLVEKSIIHFWI